uniref:Short-chain collagen C4-like n=1 Tax=Crassostrea virginica TaxID=6565 RepID=A0A8B8APM7_CRAVI|nr:short-chain collagen C4-like [Crassostrea virginica]
MIGYLLFVTIFVTVRTETCTGSCKDMLQGFLTGQASSALATYQIEALKREFKSFTGLIEESMNTFKQKIQQDISIQDLTRNGSVIYTRWGKKKCRSGAELVFSGFTGGSWYAHPGAAVDPLCLPRDPEWGIYKDGVDGQKAFVYGSEYQTFTSNSMPGVFEHDVPCAVCVVRNRSLLKMFPARKSCYEGWKIEYNGYLMTGKPEHRAGSMYTCVDGNPDTLHGGRANKDGYLFYLVEGRCGSLKCPPYVEGRELTCVVCSKE